MPLVQITLRPSERARPRRPAPRHGLSRNALHVSLLDAVPETEIAPGGTFWTAPRPATRDRRFAISGDADGARDPKTGKPAYNLFQVYGRMAAERNHFNINLGDTIYSDSEVGGVPPALTIPAKWEKYKQNLGFGHLRNLRRGTGLYSHWDDHEFINDFSLPEHAQAIFRAGAIAFMDYAPVTYSARDGLYRTFRWGKHLELFFLDERSFRSAKVRAICTATSRQRRRSRCATRSRRSSRRSRPRCRRPVSTRWPILRGRCSARASTPRSRRRSSASTATWKVIVNEVPIQQFFALPYDRWEGYPAEREKLLRFLQANVKNVLFLATDTHANFVNEVRLSTFGPGGPVGTGIWEVVTGPVATNTQNKEVDETLGRTGMGSAITALFYKPAPPRGVGMACASADVYSYAEVKVTGAAITVTPKDASGKLVHEETGGACGPFTFRAK